MNDLVQMAESARFAELQKRALFAPIGVKRQRYAELLHGQTEKLARELNIPLRHVVEERV